MAGPIAAISVNEAVAAPVEKFAATVDSVHRHQFHT
jgi:hypothetical protein